MYLPNIGSYKAFIKAGFAEVGIYKEHCFFDGHYVDCYILEVLNNMDNKK
jgi:RimJ/RimL family protein N-acetyltransferase